MHAKPDLRVVLEWTVAGSGSVIADVMWLKDYNNGKETRFSQQIFKSDTATFS